VHTAIGMGHAGYADCLLAKFETLVHFVDFVIRIYHDAPSSAC